MQDGEGFFYENYAEGDVFLKSGNRRYYGILSFSFRKCCVNPVLENGVFPVPISAFLSLVRMRSRLIGCLRR